MITSLDYQFIICICRHLEEVEKSEDVVLQALSCKLTGQYALVTAEQYSENPSSLYSITNIRLLPDNCATILSYPPFCQPFRTPQQVSSHSDKLFHHSVATDPWNTSTPKRSLRSSFPSYQLLSQSASDTSALSGQLCSDSTSDTSALSGQLCSDSTSDTSALSGQLCSDSKHISSSRPPSSLLLTRPSLSRSDESQSVPDLLVANSISSLPETHSGNKWSPSRNTLKESFLSSDYSWQHWTEITDPIPESQGTEYTFPQHVSIWDAACCHDNDTTSLVSCPPAQSKLSQSIVFESTHYSSCSPSCDSSVLSCSLSQLSMIDPTCSPCRNSTLNGNPSSTISTSSPYLRLSSCNSTPSSHKSINSLLDSHVSYWNPPTSSCSLHGVGENSEPADCPTVWGSSIKVSLDSDRMVKTGIPQDSDMQDTPELFSQLNETCSPELFPITATPVIPRSKCLPRTVLLKNVRTRITPDIL